MFASLPHIKRRNLLSALSKMITLKQLPLFYANTSNTISYIPAIPASLPRFTISHGQMIQTIPNLPVLAVCTNDLSLIHRSDRSIDGHSESSRHSNPPLSSCAPTWLNKITFAALPAASRHQGEGNQAIEGFETGGWFTSRCHFSLNV